jgi:hypothetical protein
MSALCTRYCYPTNRSDALALTTACFDFAIGWYLPVVPRFNFTGVLEGQFSTVRKTIVAQEIFKWEISNTSQDQPNIAVVGRSGLITFGINLGTIQTWKSASR